MRKSPRIVLLLALLSATFLVPSAASAAPLAFTGCQQGQFADTHALWMACIPAEWNGDAVVYAHGYTAYNAPLGLQNLTLPDGTYIPDLIQSLHYAFVTTSYRENGLAVLSGVQDIVQVTDFFWSIAGRPRGRTYLTGVSEGGLVTTLAAERYPATFSGGLATCGPIGDFTRQINYYGDFRVLFDYFYPNVLPPSPIAIPQAVIDNWDAYTAGIANALAANPHAAQQLLKTSRAPIDPANPAATTVETTVGLLWYNVWATNDAQAKLGGNPYGNTRKIYVGSDNDLLLNRKVERFRASPLALTNLMPYQTSGRLSIPLVTLHTTGDEIVPYWHELLYAAKAAPELGTELIPIPIVRYGHCSFTSDEVMAAFGILVWRVTGQQPAGLRLKFDPQQVSRDFARTQRTVPTPGGE